MAGIISNYLKRKAAEKLQHHVGRAKVSIGKRCPNDSKGRHSMSPKARDVYWLEDEEGEKHKYVMHMCANGCGKVMREGFE